MAEEKVTGIKATTADALSMLGEGIHTGFRKGTEAPGSAAAWNAIAAPDSGWDEALGYALWGLEYMGYAIVKVEK